MERYWIYQSNRVLNAEECESIVHRMKGFTTQWKAHGKQLAAEAFMKYNLFLIIRMNESVAQATGCSIDKSVHQLKEIQQELGVDFLDRMQIAYRDGNEIKVVSRQEFESLLESNQVNDNTIVFNNTVSTTDAFESDWEVPLKNSWHARVFTL